MHETPTTKDHNPLKDIFAYLVDAARLTIEYRYTCGTTHTIMTAHGEYTRTYLFRHTFGIEIRRNQIPNEQFANYSAAINNALHALQHIDQARILIYKGETSSFSIVKHENEFWGIPNATPDDNHQYNTLIENITKQPTLCHGIYPTASNAFHQMTQEIISE